MKDREYPDSDIYSAMRRVSEANGNRSMTYMQITMHTDPPKELTDIILREDLDRMETDGKTYTISMSHLVNITIMQLKEWIVQKRLGLGKLDEDDYTCVIYQFKNLEDAIPNHLFYMENLIQDKRGIWMYIGKRMHKI
ncbi:MAG: hypothetical protein V1729_03510 [Candidatus Woesearchaeota archaeon]